MTVEGAFVPTAERRGALAELGMGDVLWRGGAAEREAAVAAAGPARNLARLVHAHAQARVREREGAGAACDARPEDRHVDAARVAVPPGRCGGLPEPNPTPSLIDANVRHHPPATPPTPL